MADSLGTLWLETAQRMGTDETLAMRVDEQIRRSHAIVATAAGEAAAQQQPEQSLFDVRMAAFDRLTGRTS